MAAMPEVPAGQELAVLGGGCFWCLEACYQQLKGVSSVVSGYAGGHVENPTYEEVRCMFSWSSRHVHAWSMPICNLCVSSLAAPQQRMQGTVHRYAVGWPLHAAAVALLV